VYYPGLPSDPFHEIAKNKCVVLEEWFLLFRLGKRDAIIFLKKMKLFTLIESLGGGRVTGKLFGNGTHRFRR
jgi:cystathionine beta-lyase